MTYPAYMTPDELERRAYIRNDTLLASLFAICADQEKQIDLLEEKNADQLEQLEVANAN